MILVGSTVVLSDGTSSGGGPISAADIDDASTTGRTVLTGTAAEGRAALAPPRTLDASHVYAWRCDDAAGAGTVAEANGGPALSFTGSAWVQGDGGLYRGALGLHLASGAAVADRASTTASLTMPAAAFSLEVDFILSPRHLIVGATSTTYLAYVANGGTTAYAAIALSFPAAAGMYALWKGSGSESLTVASEMPLSKLAVGLPHHLMLAVTPGGVLSFFVDGELVSSVAASAGGLTGTDQLAAIGHPSNSQAPVGRFGELRISNVARDAAYARAAFASLRARA